MPTEKEYMLEETTAENIYQPKLTAGRNISISEYNVISSPDPPPPGSTVTVTPNQLGGNLIATVTVDSNTYNLYSPAPQVMTGASSESRGEQGLVPAPALGYQDYVLYGDGTWKDPEIPNIIANPSVSATEDLTKIFIDGTVYEISDGGGGSSDFEAVGLSSTEYDELTLAEKQDTDKLYMVTSDATIENIDMLTDAVSIYESGALITFDSPVQTTLIYTNTTIQIAQNCYYAPIDITNVDTIKYNLSNSGTFETINPSYTHNYLRDLYIGITLNPPSSSWQYGPNINYAVSNHYHAIDDAEESFENETLDISNFTGQYYIVIAGCGWNSVINNFKTISANVTRERNIYWDDNIWSSSGAGGNSQAVELTQQQYNNLTPTQKKNGDIYFVKQIDSSQQHIENLSLTFLNDTTTFEVGDNFISAEGVFTHDSSYGIIVTVNGSQVSASRTHNGVIEGTYNDCTYEDGIVTFSSGFVRYYCGSSTVDFECVYSDPSYKGSSVNYLGLEYGKDNVIPNPSEEPTEELNTVKIDGTIYSISANEGEDKENIRVLYNAQDTSQQNSIILNDFIEKYDEIHIHLKCGTSGRATIGYTYITDAMQTSDIIGGEVASGNGYIWYTYTKNSKTLTLLGYSGNYYIQSIIGVNYIIKNDEQCYLNEGLIGKSGNSYVTCNLDKKMTNGLYYIIADDNGTKYGQSFVWSGQNLSINFIGTLVITETTAGLTQYGGAFRDIAASIYKVGGGSSDEGGSDVTITPAISSGLKIADYEINETPGEIYIPTPVSLVELSKNQYNNLTPQEKLDTNKIYFVYDD